MPANTLKIYLPSNEEFWAASPDLQLTQKFEKHVIDKNLAIKAKSPEQADLIIVFQEWSFKVSSYANALTDSPFFKAFAHKMYVINYDDIVGEGFLPGCYTSLCKSKADLSRYKPCAYPKDYNEQLALLPLPPVNPSKLFCFRGTSHSHPLRKQIFTHLAQHNDADVVDVTKAFHSHTKDDKLAFAQQMLESVFVLCPRGWSPTTYRLFESMCVGRCPVIIADEWIQVPGPDWSSCSVRVAESDIARIPEILADHRPKGLEFGARARKEWLAHFAEEAKYQYFYWAISELYATRPMVTRTAKEYEQHWRSKAFLRNNGWTLRQKVMRRLSALLG